MQNLVRWTGSVLLLIFVAFVLWSLVGGFFVKPTSPSFQVPSESVGGVEPGVNEKVVLAHVAHVAVEPPVPEVRQPRPAKVTLWTLDNATVAQMEADVPIIHFSVEPLALKQFHVGQILVLALPEKIPSVGTTLGAGEVVIAESVAVKLLHTRNQGASVNIWTGDFLDADPNDNLIVARGVIETHITIATARGTYTAIVNNHTGEASLINEGDLQAKWSAGDDGIHMDTIADKPPLG